MKNHNKVKSSCPLSEFSKNPFVAFAQKVTLGSSAFLTFGVSAIIIFDEVMKRV